jgi:sugar-specific transcriptional regulator TrmB
MQHELVLKNILSVFELSDNCIQLYIKSFEHGEQNVSQLAQKLKMDRSSAYLAVEQLRQAGLIEVDETKRPMSIWAIEPRKVLGRIDAKVQSLEETLDIAYNSLPQLQAAYKSKNSRPVMQSYVGEDGLNQIMDDILDRRDTEILLLSNQLAEKELFNNHNHNAFIRKRKQHNVKIRVIATDDPYSKKLQSEDAQNLRITKILKGQQPFASEVYIYGDKVAMLSFKDEIIGFIVSSPDFANLMRWQFEGIWSVL